MLQFQGRSSPRRHGWLDDLYWHRDEHILLDVYLFENVYCDVLELVVEHVYGDFVLDSDVIEDCNARCDPVFSGRELLMVVLNTVSMTACTLAAVPSSSRPPSASDTPSPSISMSPSQTQTPSMPLSTVRLSVLIQLIASLVCSCVQAHRKKDAN
jgi:hypothetical protein